MKRRAGRYIGQPFRFASTGETYLEAASRLGIKPSALRMRLHTYRWPEKEALSFKSRERPRPSRSKYRTGARPGVKFRPLTAKEIGTLRAFSEGMTTRQIAQAKGLSLRMVRRIRERLRLKLGAYTNDELMYKVGKSGIIDKEVA